MIFQSSTIRRGDPLRPSSTIRDAFDSVHVPALLPPSRYTKPSLSLSRSRIKHYCYQNRSKTNGYDFAYPGTLIDVLIKVLRTWFNRTVENEQVFRMNFFTNVNEMDLAANFIIFSLVFHNNRRIFPAIRPMTENRVLPSYTARLSTTYRDRAKKTRKIVRDTVSS